MTSDIAGIRKKFISLFGETVEKNKQDYILVLSASRIEGIISLNLFYKTHTSCETRYNFTDLPKVMEHKNQVIAFGNRYFPFERIKTILENFFQNSVEVGLYHGKEASVLVFKLDDDFGIMIANKVNNEKKDPYEILYKWNDLFFHKSFGDDMEL